MADINLTLREFENLMQEVIATITGLDANANVRVSWPSGGAPAAGIEDDIVFIQCYEVDSPINREREQIYTEVMSPSEFNMATNYTRVMQVGVILYGDNSFENAQAIRDNMFYPEIRLLMSRNNLYLVHDIPAPRRVPELFNDQWWKRVDMTMRFNELVVRNVSVPIIESMEVIVRNSDGNEIADINIQ